MLLHTGSYGKWLASFKTFLALLHSQSYSNCNIKLHPQHLVISPKRSRICGKLLQSPEHPPRNLLQNLLRARSRTCSGLSLGTCSGTCHGTCYWNLLQSVQDFSTCLKPPEIALELAPQPAPELARILAPTAARNLLGSGTCSGTSRRSTQLCNLTA